MKLYHFNPNDHGYQYFVMSESLADAKNSLIKYLFNCKKKSPSAFTREHDLWVTSLKIGLLPGKYTIDIHKSNKVIQSEIS